jgi:uncharacterized protein involved in exopolysaccharide biosynthesis
MKLSAIAKPGPAPGSAGPPAFMRGYTLRDLLTTVFFYRRRMLLAFIVPVLLGAAAAALSKPAFVAQARLLVLYSSDYVFRPTGGQPGSSVALDRDQIIEGELQILKSSTLAASTLDKVGLDRVYPGTPLGDPRALQVAIRRMGADLSVTSIPQSNILELSFRNRDPEVAAAVLQALIAEYLERREAIFHRAPAPAVQADQDAFLARLHAAEQDLSRFAQEHGIADLDQQMNLLLQEQAANREGLESTTQSIAETSAKLAAIKQQLEQIPQTVQAYADSDRSQRSLQLNTDLVRLQIQRSGLAAHYDSNYPPIQDLDRQIAAVQAQIASEPSRDPSLARTGVNPLYQDVQGQELALQATLSGLQAKAASLNATMATLATRIRDLSGAALQYRDLKRNRDVLDESYRTFVRSSEETQMAYDAERSRAANVRVVQPPVASAAPLNMRLVLALGGIVIGFVAAGTAMIVGNAFRQVFVTVRDVSLALDLPVLVAVEQRRGRRFRPRAGQPQPAAQMPRTARGMIGA